MFKKLISLIDITMLKFLIVGGINTVVGMAIMFGSYNILHFSYWVSSALNYSLASILSYFLNKHFTFKSNAEGSRTVVRFIINIAVCYLVAYGIAKPLVTWLFSGFGPEIQDNIAMLTGMVFFTTMNYFGQRFFAFRE